MKDQGKGAYAGRHFEGYLSRLFGTNLMFAGVSRDARAESATLYLGDMGFPKDLFKRDQTNRFSLTREFYSDPEGRFIEEIYRLKREGAPSDYKLEKLYEKTASGRIKRTVFGNSKVKQQRPSRPFYIGDFHVPREYFGRDVFLRTQTYASRGGEAAAIKCRIEPKA